MKFLTYLSMIVFCLSFSLMSCGGDSEAKQAAEDALGDVTAPAAIAPAATTPPATPEPPQNAEGVWHYTCPSGCAGGGGAAGPCATCGATLAHNTAYHNSGGNAAAAPAITPPGATAGDAGSVIPPPAAAPKTPEPPQNAKGVWHYTCGKGCAGGAGAAGQCGTCGGALAHNAEYHN